MEMVWKLRETNDKHRMPKSMVRLIESIANRREVFVRKDKRISFFFGKGELVSERMVVFIKIKIVIPYIIRS